MNENIKESKIKENNKVEDIIFDTIKINNIEKLDDILDKWMMDDIIPEEQTIEVPLHVIKEFKAKCYGEQHVNTLKGIKDEKKKYRLAKISDIVRYVIMIGLSVFLEYQWLGFTLKAAKLGQLSSAMEIPMVVPYYIIDFGVFTIIIHSLFRLIISIVDHESIIDPQVLKEADE